MQVISTVVGRQQAIGMLRVADYSVEIDHCIEMTPGANPAIHLLPVGFAHWARMIVA